MRPLIFFIVTVAAAASPRATQADVIDLNVTLGPESTHYTPHAPDPGVSSAMVAASSFDALSAHFADLGDTTVNVHFNTPITADFTGVGEFTIIYDIGLSYNVSGALNNSALSASFLNFVGDALPAPATHDVMLGGPGSTQVRLIQKYVLAAGTHFSFDALTLSFVAPASFMTNFPADGLSPNIYITGAEYGLADPMQFVHITTIPEPASICMLGLGALVFVRRRR
ncbi:MAG: PEP-CTERM sorting domain-containing protein [Planctomycetes bacterium]|nr:PEP-CTERM sorting domain-containing protein [Planctomycetota bacterium]